MNNVQVEKITTVSVRGILSVCIPIVVKSCSVCKLAPKRRCFTSTLTTPVFKPHSMNPLVEVFFAVVQIDNQTLTPLLPSDFPGVQILIGKVF